MIIIFSYKDINDNIWFFDIRGFLKLINTNQLNPYTREEIPNNIKNKTKKIINILKHLNINLVIEEYTHDNINNQIKQRVVNIFSQLTTYGFDCDINWFMRLSLNKLKLLYKLMEDLWNYRLQL